MPSHRLGILLCLFGGDDLARTDMGLERSHRDPSFMKIIGERMNWNFASVLRNFLIGRGKELLRRSVA